MTGLERLKRFAKSPHHAWLAALTLGVGLATAHPVGMIAGAVAYALGWIYLPDSKRFRRWADRRAKKESEDPEAIAKAARLREQRAQLFRDLTPERQRAYQDAAAVAGEIEARLKELPADRQLMTVDLQMQPLDSLMATYLRLLHTEQRLDEFISAESAENLDAAIEAAAAAVDAIDAQGEDAASQQLAESRRQRLETLRRRRDRLADASSKRALALAEQDRLSELLKLARAELVTSQDPSRFKSRIDAEARQIGASHAWISEWDDAPDVDPTFDLIPGARVGFAVGEGSPAIAPPPIPQSE